MAYDVIVIGAGHNGLACATILAKEARRVLIVEQRDVIGGLCAGEEFHPGYRHTGLLHDTSGLRPWLVEELGLSGHGLKPGPAPHRVFSPQTDGPGLVLSSVPDESVAEIARHSDRDARQFQVFGTFLGRLRKVIEPLLNKTPVNPSDLGVGDFFDLAPHGIAARRLGKRDMMELLRIPPMCVADWLREWFETELLNASIAGPAISGGWTGPWSPGTSTNFLMQTSTWNGPGQGGVAAVVSALENAATGSGVEIRTGAAVKRIDIEQGAVRGITLLDGDEIEARSVVSSCDPRTTFLDLISPRELSHKLEQYVRDYRMRGTTAKVHLALNRPLEWASRPGEQFEYIRTGEELDDLERAFDAVKYRQRSERPVLEVHVPTVARPDLAPQGHSVASVLVHFAPHHFEEGWSDSAREALGDAVVDERERYAPGARDLVVGREVLTPVDIEKRYGLAGGHIYHGEHGLDQLITRPVPGCTGYATPLDGLYLCGSGCHPGGGVTGAPGALAAHVIQSSRQ